MQQTEAKGTRQEGNLPQPDEKVKDVGVVVDHSSSLHIGGELGLALSVECLIEIILTLVELVLTQCDRPAQNMCHSRRDKDGGRIAVRQ